MYLVNVEVTAGARKHGISDQDMHRAVRHAMRTVALDDNKTLMIGADHAGQLLEIVVADMDTDHPRIIHAMRLRRSFYQFLDQR